MLKNKKVALAIAFALTLSLSPATAASKSPTAKPKVSDVKQSAKEKAAEKKKAAAKKKAPSLQERIFVLKKMPGNAAPAVEAGADEEMSDVDGDGDAGGGRTHGVSGE